jgi:type IV pilus assembly protein PilE
MSMRARGRRGEYRCSGFTLIELMIALVLVGIIAAISLPTYNSQVSKSRRADCQGVMMGFSQAMEKYYAINFSYAGAADGGADTGVPASTLYPVRCPIEGATFYNLTINAADASSYTLRATPVSGGPQDGDGILEINSLGQRLWDENGDDDTADAGENDWQPG